MKEYHESVAKPTPPTDAIVHQSVNRISLLVGVIVAGAMLIDGRTVTISVLAGVGFYLFVAVLLITLPFLTQFLMAWMHEVTIRRHDELPYKYAQVQQRTPPGIKVVDPLQLPHEPTATRARLPEPVRFVPAVPDTNETVRVDAYNFICQLFDRGTGRPIPNKITKNKWQIQHASPTPEAIEYLMALGIVKRGNGNQLYYNLDEYEGYPTLQEAVNAVRTGVKPSPWQGGKEKGEGGAA